MKTNAVIFWIIAIYFLVIGIVYTLWNLGIHGYIEWAGTVALFLAAALGGMIGGHLILVLRKQGGTLVEDLDDSDVDDGDPEVGEFSPWSWWPILLALSASLFILGFSIGHGFWLVFLAAPFIMVSIVGWVYEYYRGHFAR